MPLPLLETALLRLIDEDFDLLTVDANERSITHRLGVHLDSLFPDWDVDCEYNRNGIDPKELRLTGGQQYVYPDVIVHRRGTGHNLPVIEVKKSNNPADVRQDIEKLEAFVEQFGYQFAAAVVVTVGDPPDYDIVWQHPRQPGA